MSGKKGASGGRRPGAGRKPNTAFVRDVTGNPGRRGVVLSHPGPPSPPVEPSSGFEPPAELLPDERRVWMDLAPHALATQTLTTATVMSFELLCRNVALERVLSRDIALRGGPNHRWLIQKVDAGLLRFNLSPCGKPMGPGADVPEEPANPLAKVLVRSR